MFLICSFKVLFFKTHVLTVQNYNYGVLTLNWRFNIISAILWQSVYLLDFCGVTIIARSSPANVIFSEWGPSWSWSYSSWIYNYLCNQCVSPLTLWIRIPLRRGAFDTTLCDKVCQWLAEGRWFSPGTPVSSTNKTDRHYITKILLKPNHLFWM